MARVLVARSDDSSRDGPVQLADHRDVIEQSAFEQILDMDEEGDKDFSKSIVYGFFDQAETTFEKMERAISSKDLRELSHLGHFLKGSSATLGLTKVKDACEKIQNFGARKDESGTADEPDDNQSLANIKLTLKRVKEDYKEVARILKRYYGDTDL
ncbi:Signal transduction histidine kinase, phosphotransfer (Hpt) domain containing protein [Elaphomyces granulatus]